MNLSKIMLRLGFCGLLCGGISPAEPSKQIVAGSSAGDTPGEEQPPPSGYPIPPAPALSPAEALKTFRLPPGYRVELVASEPLVNTPVALDFDPDGRIWVVEMRGYQNDPEGSSRMEPIGRIVVLEDSDHDGKMDRSTVYMEWLGLASRGSGAFRWRAGGGAALYLAYARYEWRLADGREKRGRR